MTTSMHLKFVDYNLLRTPHKESMDLSDEFLLLSTGYAPKNLRLQGDLSRALRAAPGLAAALLRQSLFCGPRLR